MSVIMTLAFSIYLILIISYDDASAQLNQTGQDTIFTSDNNMTTAASNSTGIMENTSGMIDDAFDALKDTFGSLFGK